MVKENDITGKIRIFIKRLSSVLMLVLVTVMLASPGVSYAANEKEQEAPIREVHNVRIENEVYCFFVTHNVVLTPAEVAEMTDEELTYAILERAGLYMKKANCKKASHKAITIKDWTKKNHGFRLSNSDIEEIRMAEPVDGTPVKFYMDLIVTLTPQEEKKKDKEDKETEETEVTETEIVIGEEGGEEAGEETGEETEEEGAEEPEEETEPEEDEPLYSTYKKTSPRLLFAVVATEEDAVYGEEICKEDKKEEKKEDKKEDKKDDKKDNKKEDKKEEEKKDTKTDKYKASNISIPEGPEEEMLPEYRTINMADRSGDPIEETLKDGSPVNLEWVEPKKIGNDEESSFIDRIPGGMTGLIIMTSVAAAAIAAAVIAAKKKRTNE